MKQVLLIALVVFWSAGSTLTQTPPPSRTTPRPGATPPQIPQRQGTTFEVSEYGVDFQADPRLIVVMAALEAAGFDPMTGREPSVFRSQVRKDLADLDPDLRARLRSFYERNRLPAPATPADQAARYVSLALALGPVPGLDAPERSEDLPAGLLDVLDFASLVREFYRKSVIDDKLTSYVRAYQAEGDRLRQPASEMVHGLLTYLHTRPMTKSLEKVQVKTPGAKKQDNKVKTYSFHEKERRFVIMPDLLAPPGTINFRIIGDDYYAVVPEGTDPASSELRRAYLQYVIDALVLRFNKEIAARRDAIKQLLNEREKAGSQVSADVFLTVGRSLVAAADARYEELGKLESLSRNARARLAAAKDEPARAAIMKSVQADVAAVQDDTAARLADEYEKGAVLSFYFADQLKGIESSGFDIANFLADMINSFDPAREAKRPAEYAEAKQRAAAARQARLLARKSDENNVPAEADSAKNAALVRELSVVEETLRLKDYNNAESRLKALLKDYPREPRIFFALAQTANLAASDATDEQVQADRLGRALSNYRLAIEASSPETDKAILSRAHESMGRINAFLENNAEAARQFDEAIKLGDVRGGAYKEALEGKRKLQQP
ncbi:MAG TPA: hypothetical protein VFU37_17815 [Pyrinomonadaceae bacterium]|nr:hypothetical protein [Pyrinomonadaceae bacterium]